MWVTGIAVCVVGFYPIVRSQMLDQSDIYTYAHSSFTVNAMLALYMYGLAIDRFVAKRFGKITTWVICLAGLAAIFTILKFGLHWETRW